MEGFVMGKRKTAKKARGGKSDIATMNVSMPGSMRRQVDERVMRRGFGNSSEYMRHLIRQDPDEAIPAWLEDKIEAGLKGPFEIADDAWWADRAAHLESALKKTHRRKSA
jgi:antitoxin ParD1/3/4